MSTVVSTAHRTLHRRIKRLRSRAHSVLDVIVIGSLAYGGGALLNATHLHRRAEQLPYGSSRDAAMAMTGGLRWASTRLGLGLPAHVVDALTGHHSTAGTKPPVLVPVPMTTMAPTGTTIPSTSSPTTTATLATLLPHRHVPDLLLPDGGEDQGSASVIALASATPGGTEIAVPATVTEPATTLPPTTTTTVAPKVTLRAGEAADPVRVYVGGDSLSQGIGTSLARDGSEAGTFKALEHGVISSGLTRPDYYDWPAELGRAQASGQPEAYVLMFGANDPQTIQTASGSIEFGDPRWEAAYRERVTTVMASLSAAHPVIWLGLPAVGRADLEAQLTLLNRIYAETAAGFPNVTFIDVRAITGPQYSPYIADGSGRQVLVRAQDKVHFTPAGYDLLAKAVVDRLAALGVH